MKKQEADFVPILLANDINSYSMARAFHEEYGVKSVIIGKFKSGPNHSSKISDFFVVPKIENNAVFLHIMDNIAQKYKDKKLLLIGCGDSYVSLIINNKETLQKSFIIPYIDKDLMNKLIDKERFYTICDQYNIDYPKTFIYTKDTRDNYNLGFDFPVIAKPSNGVSYWEHPFLGQDKVFKLKNKEELDATAKKIFDSGYVGSLIVQDFIPGDDSFMRVMTCYSDKDAKVKLVALGHVLLEEHTPRGLGNHAAILSAYDEDLANKIKTFLEKIRYIGFSNFDIKYDTRDGKYKIFEINIRQGRSNYYVTGSGHNLAKYLVNDYIYNKILPLTIVNENSLWLVIPRSIVFKYTKSAELKNKIKLLIKNGKYVNPLFYKVDNNIMRILHLIKSHFSHFKKYKKYYK